MFRSSAMRQVWHHQHDCLRGGACAMARFMPASARWRTRRTVSLVDQTGSTTPMIFAVVMELTGLRPILGNA